MALEALKAYEGQHVVVIGEWDGDTGSREFSNSLLTHWDLERAIELPNWSDTAHDFTLWKRRPHRAPSPAAPWPCCSQSGRYSSSWYRE
jgi:hypothetical protein